MRHTPADSRQPAADSRHAIPGRLPPTAYRPPPTAYRWLKKNWQLAVFPLSLTIMFWDVLIGKRFFWEDALQFAYPNLAYLIDALRHFRIPCWTPYVFSGTPFAGEVYYQTFYPVNWILALLVNPGTHLSFFVAELHAIVHLLIAGLAAYVMFKGLGLSKMASLLGGFSFMLSGFMVIRVIHVTIISTLAWFPLVFLCFHRSLYERKAFWAVLAGMLYGLAILAGFPQFAMFEAYFLGLYTIFFVILKWRDYRYETVGRGVLSLGLLVVIGLGLAAIQFLPNLEQVKYTAYAKLSFAELTTASLEPRQLLTVLAPKLFGSVSGDLPSKTDSVEFWVGAGNYFYWETVIYAGIIPLILGIFALAERRRPLRWFGLVLGGGALLLALGKFTPVYKLALMVLPGLGRFRVPGRLGGLYILALMYLTGFGADFFLRKGTERQIRALFKGLLVASGVAVLIWILAAAGAFRGLARDFVGPDVYANSVRQWGYFAILVLAMLGITFYRSRKNTRPGIVFWLLVVVTFLDLYSFGHRFNESPLGPDEGVLISGGLRIQRPDIVQLQQEARREPFRINSRIPSLGMVMGRNQGNLDRLELIEGYAPLGLNRYAPFERPTQRMYDLLNVKYKCKLDTANRALVLVPNPTALPRAWMAYQYEVLPQDQVLTRLEDPGFDYRHVALVEQTPSFSSLASEDPVANQVSLEKREPEHLRLSVRTAETGTLVLSEMYYQEWKARLDGKSAAIYPVDYTLRGVTIPPGEHTVEMDYDLHWFKVGGLISLVTLVLSLCLIVVLKPRRQSSRVSEAKPGVDKPGE
jgi:hypothetical protein